MFASQMTDAGNDQHGADGRPRLLILTPDFPPARGGIQLMAHRFAEGIERFQTTGCARCRGPVLRRAVRAGGAAGRCARLLARGATRC